MKRTIKDFSSSPNRSKYISSWLSTVLSFKERPALKEFMFRSSESKLARSSSSGFTCVSSSGPSSSASSSSAVSPAANSGSASSSCSYNSFSAARFFEKSADKGSVDFSLSESFDFFTDSSDSILKKDKSSFSLSILNI